MNQERVSARKSSAFQPAATLSELDGVENERCDPRVPMATRHIRMRPVRPNDLPLLYEMFVREEVLWRWRFNGVVPTFESFVRSFTTGLLVQFVVEPNRSESAPPVPLGLVSSYNMDLRGLTTFVAVVTDARKHRSGLGMEAMGLFLNYLFSCWPFRKIYFETVAFNFEQFRSGLEEVFVEEGRLRDHYFLAGRYWDQYICAINREKFYEASVVRAILRSTVSFKVPEQEDG